MTETYTLSVEIDAAVEQVVKSSSDRQALTDAVRALADELGYELVAKADDPAAMLVHAKFGGHHEQHGGRNEYVTPCGTVGAANLTGMWNFISCDGCVKALIDDGRGYETDAEPKPHDGDHGTCVFGCAIRYIDCPTGSWWAHETHPTDGHDAGLGGPA